MPDADKKKQDDYSFLLFEEEPVKKRWKKILPFTGIAAGILIPAALLYLLSLVFQGTASGVPYEDEESAEVLPQMTRTSTEYMEEANYRDPFTSPGVLVGVITGGRQGDMAIIETSRANYVVFEGDLVDDHWTVSEIGPEAVVLRAGGEVLNMTLSDERKPGVMESRSNLEERNDLEETNNPEETDED